MDSLDQRGIPAAVALRWAGDLLSLGGSQVDGCCCGSRHAIRGTRGAFPDASGCRHHGVSHELRAITRRQAIPGEYAERRSPPYSDYRGAELDCRTKEMTPGT